MSAGAVRRVRWVLLVVWVLATSARASQDPLDALGFERPLGERQLLRTWHRQMALVDGTARKGSRERRAAPRIRRITEREPVQTGHGRPAPMSAAMVARRERYAPVIDAAAARHGVDPNLVHAVIRAESAYEPTAESHAGACGLMQLMPATARRFGVRDVWDPAQNIRGGVAYLRFLLDRFGADIPLAIAAYNAGEGAVAKYGNRVPPYRETRAYIRRVLGYWGAT